MHADRLDIRDIAQEWRDAMETIAEFAANGLESRGMDALSSIVERSEALCAELGCAPDPDSLERNAEDYGPSLILASDFALYAEELAEEIGAIPEGARWPVYCIDWEKAARELAHDYTLIRFDGRDYYTENR